MRGNYRIFGPFCEFVIWQKMSPLDFSNHHVFTADGRNPAPSDMYENL